MSDFKEDYFNYLKKRSFLAHVYMNFYLYPRLVRRMTGKALDVGCGVGGFLRFRKNTIGADVNEHNVNYCAEQGLNVRLINSSRYPFEDTEFDSVILDNVLEHIAEPKETFEEISRVLKSKGRLVVGVPGIKGYLCDSDHKVFYDEEKLVVLMKQFGFAVNEVIHTPIKSSYLNKKISQYCLYGVFTKC